MTKQKARRFLVIPAAVLLVLLTALLSGGRSAGLTGWALRHGVSPAAYPPELAALYERNEDARQFVRDYPAMHDSDPVIDLSGECEPGTAPTLFQWDERWGYRSYNGNYMALTGCGPVCMSMAAICLTGDASLDPWAMAQYAEENGWNVPGSGTSWSFFAEGAEGLGLDSVPIPADRGRVLENLAVGNMIVCVVGPGDFTTEGHFILLCGEEGGRIRVHDPNSRKNTDRLWDFDAIADQMQALWVLRR